MRAALVAFVIALWSGVGVAQTLEEDEIFVALDIEQAQLSILSTTDTAVFRPVIEAFQRDNRTLTLRYSVANSRDVFAIAQAGEQRYDLVISSAMDLQMKLANDGLAAPHRSPQVLSLPDWARWQDRLFAFAQEPVVMILSRQGFKGLPIPRTRRNLIALMRDRPALFEGRIGTYDPESSGAGYLFATQDARHSDTFWRLAEVMGGLSPRLYASSSDMISDLQAGRLILAYNVLGSYAGSQLQRGGDGLIIEPEDHTLTLLRTGLIPQNAARPDLGGVFLDFLLGAKGQRLVGDEAGLPPIDEAALVARPHLRPIRLDPGLLVYVDTLQRRRFLDEWNSALIQP